MTTRWVSGAVLDVSEVGLTVARCALGATTREVMSCPRPRGPASFPPETFQSGGSEEWLLDKYFLEGEVACVTGGGTENRRSDRSGAGEAGAVVAILDLDPARAEASAGRLRDRGICRRGAAAGRNFLASDVDRFAAELERRHGRVDVLVNNAGIAIRKCRPRR